VRLLDDATAEAALPVVKNDGLSRGHRALGLVKVNSEAIGNTTDLAILIGLPIAYFGRAAQWCRGRFP
jgi:hypothetical protein